MMGWAFGAGYGGAWMMACGVLIGVLLLLGVVALLTLTSRDRGSHDRDDKARPRESDALQELKLRLARGEIDPEEFRRARDALRH